MQHALLCRGFGRSRGFAGRLIKRHSSTHKPRELAQQEAPGPPALAKISIFALAAIIFWLFLRHLTTERFPSGDSGGVHYPVTGSLS